nr:hypothetical protein [Nocardia vermiculata]
MDLLGSIRTLRHHCDDPPGGGQMPRKSGVRDRGRAPMTHFTNQDARPGNFPVFSGELRPSVRITHLTWHNNLHDRTWSTTRGASPCRLQARLQRQLSAGKPPETQLARPPLIPVPASSTMPFGSIR